MLVITRPWREREREREREKWKERIMDHRKGAGEYGD
jgi:hypothetical protein